MPTYTAAVWERPNVYTEPQTGEFHDTGGQVWDMRHSSFAGGIPMDGTTDARPALAAAAAMEGVTRIYVPEGTFVVGGEPIDLEDGMEIIGAGKERTVIVYTQPNDGTRRAAFRADGKTGVRISGIQVIHTGSRAVDRMKVAGRDEIGIIHGYCFELKDCFDSVISDCYALEGLYGFYVHNSVDATDSEVWSTNRGNAVRNCIARAQYNAGFYVQRAYGGDVTGCAAYACGYDGFKFPGRNRSIRVSSCHSEGHGRDGFDFYDGVIEGVLSDLISTDNSVFGYEFKGAPDDSGNYVFRDTVVSNLIASRNGFLASWSNTVPDPQPGFSITEVRGVSFNGLMSIGNAEDGVRITKTQGCTFTACHAGKNARHGWSLDEVSRCSFVGCYGLDNSWTDGVEQNGLYDGFSIGTTSSNNMLIGCGAFNSTSAVARGGQRYGIIFDSAASSANYVIAFFGVSNVTGVTGAGTDADTDGVIDTGITAQLAFSTQRIVSFVDTSTFRGPQMLNPSRMGTRTTGSNSEIAAERTDGATVTVSAQASHGLLHTEASAGAGHELWLGANGNARFAVTVAGHWAPVVPSVSDLGTAALPFQDLFMDGVITLGGGITLRSGTGSPEGVVTANKGSKFYRSDGGAGTSEYTKESGAGNTGWVAK